MLISEPRLPLFVCLALVFFLQKAPPKAKEAEFDAKSLQNTKQWVIEKTDIVQRFDNKRNEIALNDQILMLKKVLSSQNVKEISWKLPAIDIQDAPPLGPCIVFHARQHDVRDARPDNRRHPRELYKFIFLISQEDADVRPLSPAIIPLKTKEDREKAKKLKPGHELSFQAVLHRIEYDYKTTGHIFTLHLRKAKWNLD